MTTQTSGWKSAFTAFLDRRALIMLFLGFSAGIPILLIFSSLSLWLGEAGIDKSAVTFLVGSHWVTRLNLFGHP